MTILEIFKSLAKKHDATIGIGLGDLEDHNIKVYNASLQFLKEFNSRIILYGNENAIQNIKTSNTYDASNTRIEFIKSDKPTEKIFDELQNNQIQGIVRGNLSSTKFLANLKEHFNITEINRLALLETFEGFDFFYGPVGIDECNNLDKKTSFVEKAIKQLISLKIDPRVSILSGGRLGDRGRDKQVDESISIAEEVVKFVGKKFSNVLVSHDEILIENAIQNESNVIIAPDGISGNLIYRTLIHLGGGKAYGAIYMDIESTIIDTSRVGNFSEIYGALTLALALTSK